MIGCTTGGPATSESEGLLSSTVLTKLTASGARAFDELGLAVAVSGTTAVVAAPLDDTRGTDAGAAYVFVRGAGGWTQQAKLVAADAGANEGFGASVAIQGDTILVGAIFDDLGQSDAGAVYVFTRSGAAWTQQAKLIASDAAPDDQLGVSVALSGNTAVVGTTNDDDAGDRSGGAYVFVRTGAAWSQQAKLTAADAAAADQMGISVAVDGDTAVVGSYGDDDNGRSSGSVYVFTRAGTAWSQQAKLLAADGSDIAELGISTAIQGDTVVAGAVFDRDHGAAYVFTRTGATWSQQAKLVAGDPGNGGENFGNSVALSGNTVLVGAPNDDDLGGASGSAYLFSRTGAAWSQQAKLTAADGETADLFGTAVALSGDVVVIGAIGDDDRASSAGAAYVSAPDLAGNGAACSSGATCASGFCTDGVCCNTACGGGTSDCQACAVAAGAAVDGTCAPRPATTVCRAPASSCDLPELCSGGSAACPGDRFKPDFSLCSGWFGLPGICLAHTCLL
jgi:hypothetical protein